MNFFKCLKQLNRMSFFNKNLGKSQRYTAFTLAEVLITLGIIGVVAEMTIPDLVNKTQNQEHIVAYKKEFSVLAQAYITLLSQNEGNDWDSHNTMMTEFASVLKTQQTCTIAGSTCWHSANVIKSLPTTTGVQYYAWDWSGWPGLVTVDGMKLIFNADTTVMGWIMLDVNGDKAPNVIGKDIFGLRVYDGKTLPFSSGEFGTCNPPATNGNASYVNLVGFGCSEYYMEGNSSN